MLFRKPQSARGFSLPELLVVMAIMLLLASLLIPRRRGAIELAERAAAEESMHAIQSSQEAYRITNGSYASSFRTLTSLRGGPLLAGQNQPGPGGMEDVLLYKGYVFRLKRTASDQYTVTAEPVMNRTNRDWFQMDQHSPIRITRGSWEILHQDVGAGK